jgi:hypothetical protein
MSFFQAADGIGGSMTTFVKCFSAAFAAGVLPW